MVLSRGWYLYQRTTYRILSSVLIGLMIFSTGYLASSVPSLHDRLVKGGLRIPGDGSLTGFVCLVDLVWCPGNNVNGHCVMDFIFVDGDGIWRGRIIRNGPTVFRSSFDRGSWSRQGARVSCLGGRSTNAYWCPRNVRVTRTDLSNFLL